MKNKKALIIGIACFLAGIIATSVIFMMLAENEKDTGRKRKNKKETTEEVSGNITDIPSSQSPESLTVLKVIDIQLTFEEYAIGVDKNQPELLNKINTIIKKAKSDGTIDSITGRYFGLNMLYDNSVRPVYSAEEDPTKDQLIVATNAAYPPYEYKEGDAYYGIDMELVAYIADQLGLELVIKDMDFASVCYSVSIGECDIAIAGLTINEERKTNVNFTETYYDASQKLITAANNHIFDDCKTSDDVLRILNDDSNNLTIGYTTSSTAQYLVEGDDDWGFDGLGNSHLACKNFAEFFQSNDENSCYIIDATAANNVDDINSFVNAMLELHQLSEE